MGAACCTDGAFRREAYCRRGAKEGARGELATAMVQCVKDTCTWFPIRLLRDGLDKMRCDKVVKALR